ncbi:uncharacterized protein TRUGW13939_00290 [Talaromyces rugulosus]|uniref:Uncharacterized protein n=1 Tax=Talaromyces rugulosus TaxID=121627 RepID=A0A7H8QGZ7_TALRU|nr:uncharacterized protein TRUGW13939_00290 [Talaromyces rugulosus]QKX53214.1 hypothetical protein TRUGW13939_00290 [Talaromyces rugulosus]
MFVPVAHVARSLLSSVVAIFTSTNMPASVVFSQFLPLLAVKIGRFVTNVDEPYQDYCDPDIDFSLKVVEKVDTQYDGLDSKAAQQSFTSELTALLSSTFSKRHKTSIRIITNQIKTYYLDNNGECFRNAVQSESVRRWIEQTVDEGEDIYFVVGYRTINDAYVATRTGAQVGMGGKLVMPVSAGLTAAGVVVPLGSIFDPGLTGSVGYTDEQQRLFVSQGEQIIAVQYRKVSFKWFASKTADRATLAKKTQWEQYDRPRYLHSDGIDRVEVDLEDDLAFEGEREKHSIGSEEIIFSAQIQE